MCFKSVIRHILEKSFVEKKLLYFFPKMKKVGCYDRKETCPALMDHKVSTVELRGSYRFLSRIKGSGLWSNQIDLLKEKFVLSNEET